MEGRAYRRVILIRLIQFHYLFLLIFSKRPQLFTCLLFFPFLEYDPGCFVIVTILFFFDVRSVQLVATVELLDQLQESPTLHFEQPTPRRFINQAIRILEVL